MFFVFYLKMLKIDYSIWRNYHSVFLFGVKQELKTSSYQLSFTKPEGHFSANLQIKSGSVTFWNINIDILWPNKCTLISS